ncbi:xanthine dehydrogenase family protein molybdopterin-binding subunit [Novosphingobium sp. M1R2S20]|uniref:Molybdopterin cofactor-binding domain-containing protein n=1 Tax=Novosphingobium rhizovicinum TaxID=3228928 RepID=A0ABV3RE35_9SPHN
MTAPVLNRRNFLTASLLAGGGLLFDFAIPVSAATSDKASHIGAFIRVMPDNRFIIGAKNAEIGQGAKTSLPMMIAEEFDVDWDQVTVEQTHADQTLFGAQSAGGSRTTPREWLPMRKAGAVARAMMLNAAAQNWNVPVEGLVTSSGMIRDRRSGRLIAYADLASDAARIAPPDPMTIKLKEPSQFRIIGHPVRGVDTPAIVSGKPLFGIDVSMPGLLHAVLETCPAVGGRFVAANLDEVRAMPGVAHVLTIEGDGQPESLLDGVAILSMSWWSANRAREALNVKWDTSVQSSFSTEEYKRQAERCLTERAQGEILRKGDAETAFAEATRLVEARYEYPFLAHGTLEPQNATALFRDGTIEIWAPTQNPEAGRALVSKATGLPPEKIRINLTRIGGGFGRRLMNDYMVQAAAIAVQVPGVPIKLLYNRQDEFRRDFFRPAGWHTLSAALDAKGRVTAWRDHFVTFGADGKPLRAAEMSPSIVPASLVENALLEQSLLETNLPTGWLRAPGSNALAFVTQCFLDEVAQAAGTDLPTIMMDLLGAPRLIEGEGRGPAFATGRAKGVIQKVLEMVDWHGGKSRPAGRGRGFAFYFSHAGYFAEVVELTVRDGQIGEIEVWVAGDLGSQIVNPLNALHQVQGSVIDGLGQAMAGQKITQSAGAVEQSNFDSHPFQRIDMTPRIHVEFVRTDNEPTGLGEPALPPVIPAFINAIHAATGKRVRTLPVDLSESSI